MRANAASTMQRVPEVIDVWFDSGSMPFAQYHAPHASTRAFRAAVSRPTSSARRSTRPAAGSTRCWPSRRCCSTSAAYRNVVCLGPDPGRAGPQDVEVARQRRRPVGRDRPLRRRRLPLVLLHLQAAVGRLPLLAGDDRRGGPAVPAAALEHVRLLRPLREHAEAELARSDADDSGPETSRPNSTVGRCRGCSATTETVIERLDDFDATSAGRAIAAFVDELSNWYVRRSRRRFWDGDPAAFATLHECLTTVAQAAGAVLPVPRRRDLRQPRRRRGQRPPVRLPDARRRATAELEEAMAVARETVRLGSGRARTGEAEGAPAAARRGGRRHRGRARRRSSASTRSSARS